MIGIALSMASNPSQVTVIQQAIAVLRKYGSDAHVYLPGVGMLNGLTAGNYLHTDGVTPGKVDDPVGLVLDAAGGLGVELIDTCNTASAWTPYGANTVVQNGALIEITYVSGTSSEFGAQISLTQAGGLTQDLVAGKTYQVNMLAKVNTGSVSIAVLNSVTVPNTLSFPVTSTTLTPISFIFSYISGTPNFATNATLGAGEVISLSNISVREVTGIRSSQPTTASKPILRRGALNLLTYSGDFGNAAWVKGVNATLSYSTDSQGTVTRVQMPTGSGTFVYQTYTAAAAPYTVAVLVRKHTGSPSFVGRIGAATTVVQIDDTNSTLFTATDDWSLVVRNFTGTAVPWNMLLDSVDGATALDIDVRSIGLFQGTYTAQQIQALGGIPTTTTAPASTALGPQYWQFDGSNDSLALGSVPFGLTDDFAIVAGFSSGTPSAWSSIFSCSGAGTTPRIQLLVDSANGFLKCYFRDNAGVNTSLNGATDQRNKSIVASLRKTGSTVTLSVNGLWVATGSVSALGAATFTVSALGMLAGGTDYYMGGLNGTSLIKGTVSDPDLLLLEKFVGQLSGVQI